LPDVSAQLSVKSIIKGLSTDNWHLTTEKDAASPRAALSFAESKG
jgi:hypothetical protein